MFTPHTGAMAVACSPWRDLATTVRSVPTLTSARPALTRDRPTTMPLRGLMTRGNPLSLWVHQGQEEEL